MMRKRPSLTYQVTSALTEKMVVGSGEGGAKYKAKVTGESKNHIYSFKTLKTYITLSVGFANYCKREHGCRYLEECRQYRVEYLDSLKAAKKSPYTLKAVKAATEKLYGDRIEYSTPRRSRAGITRSRCDVERDKGFLESKNVEIVTFCKCCGLRRSELQALRRSDCEITPKGIIVHVRHGKGGKSRYLRAYGTQEELQTVRDVIERAESDEKIFAKIPSHMDVHSYRAVYASRVYAAEARSLDTLPRSEKYFCRNDKKGVTYDKKALLVASKALGHNRISVIPGHYLWR